MQLSSRFPRSVDVVVHPLALQAGGPALTISGLIRRNARGPGEHDQSRNTQRHASIEDGGYAHPLGARATIFFSPVAPVKVHDCGLPELMPAYSSMRSDRNECHADEPSRATRVTQSWQAEVCISSHGAAGRRHPLALLEIVELLRVDGGRNRGVAARRGYPGIHSRDSAAGMSNRTVKDNDMRSPAMDNRDTVTKSGSLLLCTSLFQNSSYPNRPSHMRADGSLPACVDILRPSSVDTDSP